MSDTRQSHSFVRQHAVTVYVTALALIAAGSVWHLVYTGHGVLPTENLVGVIVFAVLLFLGETRPQLWMRFGDEGEVTPGWAFAYALVLLGSPLGAVATMVLTNLYVDVRHARGVLKIVFNISQVTVALAMGEIVLRAFGVDGGITGLDHLPARSGLGVLAGALTIFAVNSILTGAVLCLHQGLTPMALARASFALSMAVDGALLALAPVFVIAVEFSILMLPLLGITAFLVFHSARTALKREHEANHDALTLLLNRRAFDDRLATAIDTITGGSRPLLLVMDLDRFKEINDRLGHQIGDRLLQSFADRLERTLPPSAIASRLGGDEFAVLVPHVEGLDQAIAMVNKIHAQLAEQHDLSGFPLSAAVSIGAAVAPIHGSSGAALMASADLAMYRAKQFGTCIEFATEGDARHDVGRVGLLSDLTAAIGTNQLSVHYQPLVSLQDGRVESVEALLRWQHPEYGNIPPGEFIGMAEQTDLIGPLTDFVFRAAMSDVMSLGPDMPRLAVNVAARTLLDRQFSSNLLAVIESLGFPADRLEIEVTERDIVTGSDRSTLTIAHLRSRGVQISIDDFGTGYSSFLTLRELEADRLKIDAQFTSRLIGSAADDVIVAKVIEIAHHLGIDVVAEGVESDAVRSRLGELGCDLVQGYAIARPMPFGSLVHWLRASQQSLSIASMTAPEHDALQAVAS